MKSPTTLLQFSARVQRLGEALIVALPDEASAALPSRGQVAVTGTLNGQPWQSVLEPDGRRGHWFRVDDPQQRALALDEGARVTVAVAPSDRWPEPTVPDDLQQALDAAPDVRAAWADITPMARWEWVRWVNATRNAGTRQRRVEVAIDKLRSGSRRPCCFDLSSCTDPELARSGKLAESL